jgi:O-antigen ligase
MVTLSGEHEKKLYSADHLFFIALCFFVFTLYSPVTQVNNVAIMMMGAVWIYSGNYKKIGRLFSDKVALGIMVYYLFQVVTLLYSRNKATGGMWLEYRSPLAYLSLILGTITVSVSQRRTVLLFFAFLTAAAGFLGLLFGIGMMVKTGDTGYIYNDNLGTLFDKQAVYFAMYVNFAVMIFVYFLHKGLILHKGFRNLAVVSIGLLILVNYLLASRTSMLILALFLLGNIIYLILKQKKYLSGFILLFGVIIIGVLSTQLFPKTTNRFVSVTNSKFEYSNLHPVDHFNGETNKENWNSLNTRLAIWNCAGAVIRRNPVVGVGIGDVGDSLTGEYRKNNFYFGIKYNLNAHNQYLDVGIGMGAIGFVIFLIGMILVPLLTAFQRQNYLLIFFLVSMIAYMLTEVLLNRNQGVTFVAFFILLLAKSAKGEDERAYSGAM